MKKIIVLFCTIMFIVLCCGNANAQDDKERIGYEEILKTGVNYYNYADKDKVNIEVIVWGGIKNPGKYLIPVGTTVIDLITLAGGPVSEETIEYVKLIRMKNDSLNTQTDKIINLDYRGFFDREKKSYYKYVNPVVEAGDMITIPIEEEMTFWDYFKDVYGYVIPLAALILSILNLTKD